MRNTGILTIRDNNMISKKQIYVTASSKPQINLKPNC